MKDNDDNDTGCGCDAKLDEHRTGFLMTLPSVLKDLWPEGDEFELTISKDGNPVAMQGGSLPSKGMWE
jgi:hypothetical protein